MNRTLGFLQASWRGVNHIAQTAREAAQRRLLALAAEANPAPAPGNDAWEVVRDEDTKTDSEPATDDGGAQFDDPRLPDNGGLFDHEPVAGGYVLPEREFESDVRPDVLSDSDDDSSSEGERRVDARGGVGAEEGSDGKTFVDAAGGDEDGQAASRSRSVARSGDITPNEPELCTSFEQSQTLEVGGESTEGKAPDTNDEKLLRMPGAWYESFEDVTDSQQQQDGQAELEQRRLEEGLAEEAVRAELRESRYARFLTGGATGRANRSPGHG
jgi:hypothetical protein